MFCGKCGTQNPDGASQCQNCGAPLGKPAAAEPVMTEAESKRYRTIGIAAVAVAAVLVIVLIASIFSGGGAGSPEKLSKEFMKGFMKSDAKTIVNLMPKEVVKEAADEADMSRSELIKELDKSLDSSFKMVEDYLGKYKLSYEITGTEKVTGDKLDSVKAQYKDLDIKIKAAEKVTLAVTFDSDTIDRTQDLDIVAIKIGGSWYLDASTMDDIF